MYYSDEGSSSGSGSDVERNFSTGFPLHMLSQKEVEVVDNKYPPGFFSKSDVEPPFSEFQHLTHSTSQEQYSDMESEEEDPNLTAFYSDMDENEESDEFDTSVNYSEMFPVEAYEQRNNQVAVMNTRLEDKVDLVGGRNQDYLGLARDYKMQRKFSDPQKHPSCVLCHKESAKDTFFPCEHRCVCSTCIKTENFCDERDMPYRKNGYNICPLCASVIKFMIPFNHGQEVEKYWEWVEEVAPPLPPGFYRKFNRSAEVLHKVYIDKVEHDIIEESLCKQN